MKHIFIILFAALLVAVCAFPAFSDSATGPNNNILKDLISHINFDFSYGQYQGMSSHSSPASRTDSNFSASRPNIGIGASIKLPLLGMPDTYSLNLGYHYNYRVDELDVSYLHIDAMGTNNGYYGAFGVNLSSWNKDIIGGTGYQLSGGKLLNDWMMAGVKYISIIGDKTESGYNNSYYISQLALECILSFN